MRVLHTSDWHIGKHLHKEDLNQEIALFFDWLLETIAQEQIDVLLVSGDIFDQANPSQASLKMYYDFLVAVHGRCKVILTGGNHDSAAVLNAPKDLLQTMDITVIGGAVKDKIDLFVPVKVGAEELVVAAVPFLKDRDIRASVAGESYSDKITQIKSGLHRYFEEVNEVFTEHYKGTPFIVMGHLYIHGAAVSDSERDIQIGNQAGIEANIFQGIPDYVALGHIHKPYKVATESNVHYCGSPVSLSFSEKEDIKQINIVDISKENVTTKIVKVPKFRDVLLLEGSLDAVAQQLEAYTKTHDLPALVEVQVTEPMETLNSFEQFQQRIQEYESPDLKVLKSKLQFETMQGGSSTVVDTFSDLEDLKPLELFQKKLDLDLQLEGAEKEEFTNAFRELLQDLNL